MLQQENANPERIKHFAEVRIIKFIHIRVGGDIILFPNVLQTRSINESLETLGTFNS